MNAGQRTKPVRSMGRGTRKRSLPQRDCWRCRSTCRCRPAQDEVGDGEEADDEGHEGGASQARRSLGHPEDPRLLAGNRHRSLLPGALARVTASREPVGSRVAQLQVAFLDRRHARGPGSHCLRWPKGRRVVDQGAWSCERRETRASPDVLRLASSAGAACCCCRGQIRSREVLHAGLGLPQVHAD